MYRRLFSDDNCRLPYQVDNNEAKGYSSSGQLVEYKLSPSELIALWAKYGPPGEKPKKENYFVSAKRAVPLQLAGTKAKTSRMAKRGRPKSKQTKRKIETPL